MQRIRRLLGAVALGWLAFVGGPICVGNGGTSAAYAQSADASVLALLTTIQTGGSPPSQATMNAIATAMNGWGGNAAGQIAALFTTMGTQNSSLAGLVTSAFLGASSLPGVNAAAMGQGIGRAAASLSTSNSNTATVNAVLSGLSGATGTLTGGLTQGVRQGLTSLSGTTAAGTAASNIATAAAGTGTAIVGAVGTGVSQANTNTQGFTTNPSQGCSANAGSCD